MHAHARIEYLKVQNFRALRDVEFRDLRPLTVLLGPNGSGKSTLFDVFAFLADCFESGLRRAWDKRGRARELKTRGSDGPVSVEIKYKEAGYPVITYHLAIDERRSAPVVVEEWLQWRRGQRGRPFRFLDYREGQGRAVSGDSPTSRVGESRFRSSLRTCWPSMRWGSLPSIHASRRCVNSSVAGTCPISPPTVRVGSRRQARRSG
jgi:predicted ATPase